MLVGITFNTHVITLNAVTKQNLDRNITHCMFPQNNDYFNILIIGLVVMTLFEEIAQILTS